MQIQDMLKCQKHLCEFLLSGPSSFTLDYCESQLSAVTAARPIHILQAIQQTSENYSINLSVKGGKKLNKTVKIDAVLPTVEAGSNGLSEAQSGVELCVSDLGNARCTTGYSTNSTRGAVSKSPKGKKK